MKLTLDRKFSVFGFHNHPFDRRSLKNYVSRLLKKLPEARRAKNRRAQAYFFRTLSEAIERNEAYEAFSAAS